MPLGPYSLNGLHAFATAARHLTFTRAAGELWTRSLAREPSPAWPLVRDALLGAAAEG